MKLALITTIWKRPELTKIVLDYYKQFPNLELICVGSEGEKSKQLAKGWHYVEYKNYPVSEKHNQALKKAKELNVDAVVLIGSDELMSKELFEFYQTLTPNEKVVHGFADSHIFDCKSGKLYYYRGYKTAQSVGTGRFFSKFVLDKCNWQLWGNNLNRGLDSNCTDRLKKIGIFEKIYKLSDIDGFFVDVKHEENITSFKALSFWLKEINIEVMAKKINKTKEIQELAPAVEVKAIEIDKNKKYVFISNGKDKNLKAKSEQFGFMCEILIKKGLGTIES